MKTGLFDFELPPERIALWPCEPRDEARLLVVDPSTVKAGGGPVCFDVPSVDRKIWDLCNILEPGDVLVVNDTRVIRAALSGVRLRGDMRASVSFNLIKRLDGCTWQALAKPAKKLLRDDTIRFGNVNLAGGLEQLTARVLKKGPDGRVDLAFDFSDSSLDRAISSLGRMPIPPYIAGRREADECDDSSYQTIFAKNDGAVAAPTAGLHFTQELLDGLDRRGVLRCHVTLHVGAGTFLPVKVDDTDDHEMHAEWGSLSRETATLLNGARAERRRIICVGTTSLRVVESAAGEDGTIEPFEGETSIFICPGYRFKAVDGLITNFHLPRSTLFMLVAAFCGLETMKAAYMHAIDHHYRFYSYGDANLLFRQT